MDIGSVGEADERVEKFIVLSSNVAEEPGPELGDCMVVVSVGKFDIDDLDVGDEGFEMLASKVVGDLMLVLGLGVFASDVRPGGGPTKITNPP